MNSNQWHPAFKWSESLRVYEMLALFRYEIDAREWENRIGIQVGAAAHPTSPGLRDSKWARRLLGYERKTRSAFWQFVYSAGVPHVRLTSRTIMFSEMAVYDWLAKRSVGRLR